MTFVTQADQNAARENAKHAALVERGIREIYEAFGDLLPCDANTKMILTWTREWAGTASSVPTVHLFRRAWNANRLSRDQFVIKKLAIQIQELIDEIISLLRTGGSHSEQTLEAYKRNVLGFMTRARLIERRDEIVAKQQNAKLPVADLKAKVHEFYEAVERTQGQILPPEITAEKIKSSSAEHIMFLNRKYGRDLVNDRLFGRS